jgi:hypothetical protein
VAHLVGGEHDELAANGRESAFLVLGEHFVPRREEGVEVADGASGCEDRVAGPVRPADDLPHLLQDHVLHEDEDRGDLVGEHVRVGGRGQPLAGHRDEVEATRELIEEVRVTWNSEGPSHSPPIPYTSVFNFCFSLNLRRVALLSTDLSETLPLPLSLDKV